MQRTIGRILAIQALYAYDAGSDEEELANFSWLDDKAENSGDYMSLTQDDQNEYDSLSDAEIEGVKIHAKLLFLGAVGSIKVLDDAIKARLSKKWDITRVNRVALAILRLGAYELLFQKDTPRAVVINEAVDIAKYYTTDPKLPKFINALLDKIQPAT